MPATLKSLKHKHVYRYSFLLGISLRRQHILNSEDISFAKITRMPNQRYSISRVTPAALCIARTMEIVERMSIAGSKLLYDL